MKCEKCHQNDATVFLTQVVGGEKSEMHLCESCAKNSDSVLFDNHLSFQQFLSGLLENTNKTPNVKSAVITCPGCGMTLSEFKKVSKFGCAHCYEVFGVYLNSVIKRVQSNSQHTGKRPAKLDIKLQRENMIAQLESELKLSIMQEDYEKAASIRDQLRGIRSQEDGYEKMV